MLRRGFDTPFGFGRRHYEPRLHRHLRVAGEKYALRWKNWKFVVSPEEQGLELFDLAADPGELRNLAGLRPDLVMRFQATVGEWRAGQVARRSATPGPSREDLERLEALGYHPDPGTHPMITGADRRDRYVSRAQPAPAPSGPPSGDY